MHKIDESLLATGKWGKHYAWELYSSTKHPDSKLMTAVAGVAITHTMDKVVLTKNGRGGWEILAGHIDPGEKPREAMDREALEEGGFTVTQALPIGYRKITAEQRPAQGSREFTYPFPISYVAYFLLHTDRPTVAPSGEEILDARSFSPEELPALVTSGELSQIEYTIIKLGLQHATMTPADWRLHAT